MFDLDNQSNQSCNEYQQLLYLILLGTIIVQYHGPLLIFLILVHSTNDKFQNNCIEYVLIY
jgi:hypothetical protein